MEQVVNNKRRDFLKKSTSGAIALGLGAVAISTLTESCNSPSNKNGNESNRADSMAVGAKNVDADERGMQYYRSIISIVALSNKTCDVAKSKASAKYVKEFANFEMEETDTLKKVLDEMGVETPSLDADAQAKLDKLKSLSGMEFDRMFIQEQIDGHNKLISLADSFINDSRGESHMELHNRHIAMMARTTHKEHVTICQRLMQEGLKA